MFFFRLPSPTMLPKPVMTMIWARTYTPFNQRCWYGINTFTIPRIPCVRQWRHRWKCCWLRFRGYLSLFISDGVVKLPFFFFFFFINKTGDAESAGRSSPEDVRRRYYVVVVTKLFEEPSWMAHARNNRSDDRSLRNVRGARPPLQRLICNVKRDSVGCVRNIFF